MKKKHPIIAPLIALILASTTACSTAPQSPNNKNPITEASNAQSRAEEKTITRLMIRYRLGHDWYRISFAETGGALKGSLYEDDSLLKNATIPNDSLPSLTAQVVELQSHLTRAPAATLDSVGCFQPFEITYWNNNQIQKTSGCREKKEISQRLSRLIRESEFLIYSQTP